MKPALFRTIVAVLTVAAVAACFDEPPDQPAPAAEARPAAPAPAPAGVDEAEVAIQPQEQTRPVPAAPARAPEQPQPARGSASGAIVQPARRQGTDPTAPIERLQYTPEKIGPGLYGTRFDTLTHGLPPQPYRESPMSAALAVQGKILPLAERIPDWDNVFILPPGDEIGVYGGTIRTTQKAPVALTDTGFQYGLAMSPDGLLLVPSIFKTFLSNAQGTEFTFQIRKGARWHDGYPHTMEDVRFALEDLLLNKELMPTLPAVLRSPITGSDMRVTFVNDETFKVSFDDPNFSFQESSAMNIFSGMKGCPRCFISPSHVQKRYHIDYNEEEIPALLEGSISPIGCVCSRRYATFVGSAGNRRRRSRRSLTDRISTGETTTFPGWGDFGPGTKGLEAKRHSSSGTTITRRSTLRATSFRMQTSMLALGRRRGR